jgi:thioredoxin
MCRLPESVTRSLPLLIAVCFAGCVETPSNGRPITGCPDGDVERLEVAGGLVVPRDAKFLATVDRKDDRLVLVDCWADWCGPCLQLAPLLESLKRDRGDALEVVKVDIDQHPDIKAFLKVGPIPDVRVFRGGLQVDSFVGLHSREEIAAILKRHE